MIGKDVYTLKGKFVGRVTNASVDTETKAVSALEMKIAAGKGLSEREIVLVPYELIVAIDDIVLIGSRK